MAAETNVKSKRNAGRRGLPIYLSMALLVLSIVIGGSLNSTSAFAQSAYHTVTFAQNDSASDPVYATQTENAPLDLTRFADLSPSFSNPGMIFDYWNTEPNGSGSTYTDGEIYDFTAPLTLYAIWGGPDVTVTFGENDNGSDTKVATQTENVSTSLTLFTNLSPSFSNPDFTFSDWNTQADGGGTSYADGATYSFSSPLVLYAQWTAIASDHTVTFAENDSGADATVSTQTASAPTALTLLASLSPAFSNVGYSFDDWNTAANGSGVSYANGAIYGFSAPLVLYAQWTADASVTASFGDNGGTGSVSPTQDPSGTTITLPTASELTRTDFTLSGWNTEAGGSGTEYAPGATVVLTSNETFYAQWTETSPLVIEILANGGTGSDAELSGEYGATVTLPGVTGLTYNGYTLTSWNTSANGSGTSYSLDAAITLTIPLTLYAQWTATTGSLTVSLSANGGSGSLDPLTGSSGSTVTLPSATSVVRAGYTLTSWNTDANGSGTSYTPGQTLTLTSTLTLYAQWKKVATSQLYGAVGTFGARTAALTAGIERKIRSLATAIKIRKYTKVSLFGYSAETGNASLDKSLSTQRAQRVATYLRSELRALKVSGVAIVASGEGSVNDSTNPAYSRVEVFVS
ncbi:MAG: InlB B-repeat-containing protein [Acidimicrobiales bacterium]